MKSKVQASHSTSVPNAIQHGAKESSKAENRGYTPPSFQWRRVRRASKPAKSRVAGQRHQKSRRRYQQFQAAGRLVTCGSLLVVCTRVSRWVCCIFLTYIDLILNPWIANNACRQARKRRKERHDAVFRATNARCDELRGLIDEAYRKYEDRW